jgi:hypothetical protein
MSGLVQRRALLAPAALIMTTVGAARQQAAAQQAPGLQGFPTPEAAATALTEAVRSLNDKALAAMLGEDWDVFAPTRDRDFGMDREAYLAAWQAGNKAIVDGTKASIEVGPDGWTLPIPLRKDGAEWRFDIAAGRGEMRARVIGNNELGAIQTLLAIGDAEREYVDLNPMKEKAPTYARRLMSSAGRKDGLYWPTKAGEPASPLGRQVAVSQPDGASPGLHYGYNYRLLYAQGSAAPGGARDYVLQGRMMGGFAAIAWPARYGVTGVMTFIMGHDNVVWEQDLGPGTATRAGLMTVFNPDTGWKKADTTPL